MRILTLDWHSDWTLFLLGIFLVCLFLGIMQDRLSPDGKKRKQARTVAERPGEIID